MAKWEAQHTGAGEQIGVIWRACTYGEETENRMSKAFILKDKDIKKKGPKEVFAGDGKRGWEFDSYSWEAAVGSWQRSRADKIWDRRRAARSAGNGQQV